MIDDFELADRAYNLRMTAQRAAAEDRIDPAAAKRWLSDWQARSRAGSFLCTLAAFTVAGGKPGRGTAP